MKTLFWIIAAIGLVSLMLGAVGMDSECLTVPIVMVVGGCVLFLIGGKGLEYCEGQL